MKWKRHAFVLPVLFFSTSVNIKDARAQGKNKQEDVKVVQELLNALSAETVTGTIVTDGTLGSLRPENILEVSLTASNGVSQLELSSIPVSFSGVISTDGSLVYSGDPGTELLFSAVGGANTFWRLSPSSTPGLVLKSIFVEGSGGTVEVAAPYTFGYAIPEPTTGGLALAAFCLAALYTAIRRRCYRRGSPQQLVSVA
jgi:hypothetical protein